MDTKSRNRYRLGILLADLTVLAASFIMVSLYPYFKKDAEQHREMAYEGQAFLDSLSCGNYVLYGESQARISGARISPFRLFFPSADRWEKALVSAEASGEEAGNVEERPEITAEDEQILNSYMEVLREECNREYDKWNRRFESIRRYLDYQVVDKDGQVLLESKAGLDLAGESEAYAFQVAVRYDEAGRANVDMIEESGLESVAGALESLSNRDPMQGQYGGELFDDRDFLFTGPQNMTFYYAMSQGMLDQYTRLHSYGIESYFASGTFTKIYVGLLAAVGLAAILISSSRLVSAERSKILRAPLGIVLCLLASGIALGYALVRLIAATNQGSLYGELLRTGLIPAVAQVLLKTWNLFCWCIPFAVVCWAVFCAMEVCFIGLGRYFRERTLIGLFLSGCRKLCGRIYGFLSNIDMQDNTNKSIIKIVVVNFLVLALFCTMWFFGIGALLLYSALLFLVLRKYYVDLREKYRLLLNATNQIAEGNLDVDIAEDLGIFEPFRSEIQKIQTGFKVAVDEEIKSQKMKTDLITNVSHDLKTPLTAIITYVNLLRDDRISPDQRVAYIDVLEQKSMRLKALIEDLFEISKATSNNVTLNLVDVDIVSLLKEVKYELEDKIRESGIDFRWDFPDEKLVISLDSQKTYRIFDNLLGNIVKYAMPGTRAYIIIKREDGEAVITMKNVSANELDFDPNEITERFVRGDQARNTDGSGLGLAIAKCFVELQNGQMAVDVEADLFRATVRWPISKDRLEKQTDSVYTEI